MEKTKNKVLQGPFMTPPRYKGHKGGGANSAIPLKFLLHKEGRLRKKRTRPAKSQSEGALELAIYDPEAANSERQWLR